MIKKLATLSIAGLMILSAVAIALPSSVFAQAVPGNNGTLKIHEQGTPSGTESNDPKVCVFNLEGFGFDEGQDGYIQFNIQGGQNNGDQAGPTVAFGPTDENGYDETEYVNLDNGHYKATLYGKDIANPANPDLKDVKAKSKVFKVDCVDGEYEVASAAVSKTPATCEAGETLVYGDIENATFSGTANGTEGPADYEVVATADNGAAFPGNEATKTFTGELAGKDTGDDCVLGENPETPGKGETPEVLPTTGGNLPFGLYAVVAGLAGLLTAGAMAVRKTVFRGL